MILNHVPVLRRNPRWYRSMRETDLCLEPGSYLCAMKAAHDAYRIAMNLANT